MSTFLRFNQTRKPSEIISEFPIRFGNYYEPFLGSGEVFFNLYNNGRIFNKGYLASSDKFLTQVYKAVRDEPERLQKMILHFCSNNSEAYFNNLSFARDCSPAVYIYADRAIGKDGKWRASQFIDKNREISKDVSDIDRCSRYLNRWCDGIWNVDWELALTPVNHLEKRIKEGDLVWLDPPKIAYTADGRIDYVSKGFNESNHIYLNNFCKQLRANGIHVYMIQNNVPAAERIFGKPKKILSNGEALHVF